MAISAVLFALMGFFGRLASSSAPFAMVGAARAFVGAAVALGVARLRGAPLAARDRKAMLWRSVLGTTAMVLSFYALSSRTLSLGDTATLLQLTPVFLAVLAPIFLRERTTLAVALAIGIALAGVALVLHPSFSFADTPGVPGPSAAMTAAAAVAAAFVSSITMMLLRRLGQTESAEAIAFHFSLFAGVVLSLLSLLDLRVPTVRDAALMLATGLSAGFAQIAMTRAYALDQAARVSSVGNLSVVVSALLGALALGERPSLSAIMGMLLVIAGGVVVTFVRDAGEAG